MSEESTTRRRLTLNPSTLAALNLEPDDDGKVIAGNVAAHAYNVTMGGGLEGINLGWNDQEASTDFVVGIVNDVEEAVGEYPDDDNAWFDRLAEIADSAVPIYNHSRIMAALELGAEVDDVGLLPKHPNMADVAGVALYEMAGQIASGLADRIREEEEDDDEEENP